MVKLRISIPLFLPDWLYNLVRSFRHKKTLVLEILRIRKKEIINLAGDRDIEWSWVVANMPPGPGEALDFGSGGSSIALVAAQKGYNVTAIDLLPIRWPYNHERLSFIQGDILKANLSRSQFDLVINCSTVEHIGLLGRYSTSKDLPDGDIEAMIRLGELLKPGGLMLLTIPVGRDAVFPPFHRVYGVQRLHLLIHDFEVEKESFWTKDERNQWIECEKETALAFEASAGSSDPLRNIYALGCFILRRIENADYIHNP